MAIFIEEERNKISPISIVTWLVVLVIIGLAVYYIFFTQPGLVEIAAPSNFQSIDPLSRINLNPEDVVNGRGFQALRSTIALPTPGNSGRDNPFLAP